MNDHVQQVPVETADIEQHFKDKTKPPLAKQYRIKIDKKHFTWGFPEITGEQILALAGYAVGSRVVRMNTRAGVVDVGLSETVHLHHPHHHHHEIERFMTIPCEAQEGDGSVGRRQFELVPQDREFVETTGLRWETVTGNGINAVILICWPLPSGFNVPATDMHIRLTAGYPDTALDMAYFSPALARADGKPIGALSIEQFDGRSWQRWSRHQNATTAPWRLGVDSLETHVAYVRHWLTMELRK